MIYHSIGEIFDGIDETRGRLVNRVAGLSRAQENFRPAADAWTIAEIVEHVSIIEGQLVRLTALLLKQAEASSGAPARVGVESGEAAPIVDLRAILERAAKEKYQSPEMARPRGDATVADSLAKLRETRASILALRPRFEAADLSQVKYPHPVFGPLDLYQWLAFIGIHEDRHLRQIERLMSAPEFAGAATA